MTPRLPLHRIEAIRHLLFDTDTPISQIHRHHRVQVDRKTVYNIRLCFEVFGTPYPPSGVKKGRPCILENEEILELLEHLQCHPTEYLDELVWYCFESFDKIVSRAIICRLLGRRNMTRKKCKERAAEQSAELRGAWEVKRAAWRGEKLCFVDESACNERSADRKYGWSPVGLPARTIHSLRRGERWSILPAITIDGWLPDCLLHQGSVTGEMFLDWLGLAVLPKLQHNGYILIMDNASIHRVEGVRELCEYHGVRLEYLPPYSPDLNPIEHSFHTLKAWIRSRRELIAQYDDFEDFLKFAIKSQNSCKARKYFMHAGYNCGQWEEE
jgi:transposase